MRFFRAKLPYWVRVSIALLLIPTVVILLANTPAAHSDEKKPAPPPPKCWERPVATSILEIFQSQAGSLMASNRQASEDGSILALSDGANEAAYGAGLLVGWGETGARPAFAVVTGSGTSALIAPFAFLGEDGDQKIGDLFNCRSSSFKELADNAAVRLDEAVFAAIARRARNGRKLYLVVPASETHPATIWDASAIAVSGNPNALAYIRRILAAAVDRDGFLDPKQIPIAASRAATDRASLHSAGAGGLFYVPQEEEAVPKGRAHYFLINNGKLNANEYRAYIHFAAKIGGTGDDKRPFHTLTTSLDVFNRAKRNGEPFQFAYISTNVSLTPQYANEIDFQYMGALFLRAWKLGHIGEGWRSELPGQAPR